MTESAAATHPLAAIFLPRPYHAVLSARWVARRKTMQDLPNYSSLRTTAAENFAYTRYLDTRDWISPPAGRPKRPFLYFPLALKLVLGAA